MSKLLGTVTLMMAVCLPFCSGTLVGDATLYLEVWRSVWRFTDDSYTNGSFVNKFYHCIGTPIAENVILTSAKCLQRFSFSIDNDRIYLYGNYNQTATILDQYSSYIIPFLDADLSNLRPNYVPMVFEVNKLITYVPPSYEAPWNSGSALLFLNTKIHLNNGLQFVKLINFTNVRHIDYNSCSVSSRTRSGRFINAKLNCLMEVINTNYNLYCEHVDDNNSQVIFTSGSPIFCLGNNFEYFQVGFVSLNIIKPSSNPRKFSFTTKYSSVADVADLSNSTTLFEVVRENNYSRGKLERLELTVPFGRLPNDLKHQEFKKYQISRSSVPTTHIDELNDFIKKLIMENSVE